MVLVAGISCQKLDNDDSITSAAVAGNDLVLSEVWINGKLDEKFEYKNRNLYSYINYSTTSTMYPYTFSVSKYGVYQTEYVFSRGIYNYDDNGRLIKVVYPDRGNVFRNQYELTWHQDTLVTILFLWGWWNQNGVLAHGYISHFSYPEDWVFEEVSYPVEVRFGVMKVDSSHGGHSVLKWHSPFALRNSIDKKKYSESRYSTTIRKPNYNIVNFPMLYNTLDFGNKHDLMNRIEFPFRPITIGPTYVSIASRVEINSGMLKIEDVDVDNGVETVTSRVENLKTNREKLPISYDLKDMGTGKVTHYEFKYVSL